MIRIRMPRPRPARPATARDQGGCRGPRVQTLGRAAEPVRRGRGVGELVPTSLQFALRRILGSNAAQRRRSCGRSRVMSWMRRRPGPPPHRPTSTLAPHVYDGSTRVRVVGIHSCQHCNGEFQRGSLRPPPERRAAMQRAADCRPRLFKFPRARSLRFPQRRCRLHHAPTSAAVISGAGGTAARAYRAPVTGGNSGRINRANVIFSDCDYCFSDWH